MSVGAALILGVCVSALAAIGTAAAAPPPATGDGLRQDLEAAARLRVFFGHQSVGANVLEGLGRIQSGPGTRLPIFEVADASRIDRPGVGHAYVGTNGDPASKLAAFDRALGAGAQVDVAMVKLCYVDIGEGTDVEKLFASYQDTIRTVRARLPSLVVVHVTTPLVAEQGFLKSLAKRLLGRGNALAANRRREAYNALLRGAYEGREPLFDLARIESTRPDGTPVRGTLGGEAVPVLDPSYTDDGSHLNAAGQERAARELLGVLASRARVAGAGRGP